MPSEAAEKSLPKNAIVTTASTAGSWTAGFVPERPLIWVSGDYGEETDANQLYSHQ